MGQFRPVVDGIAPLWPKLSHCRNKKIFHNTTTDMVLVLTLQMVRNYKAKGKRLNWNGDNMQHAITDIENKTFTIRAASIEHMGYLVRLFKM